MIGLRIKVRDDNRMPSLNEYDHCKITTFILNLLSLTWNILNVLLRVLARLVTNVKSIWSIKLERRCPRTKKESGYGTISQIRMQGANYFPMVLRLSRE